MFVKILLIDHGCGGGRLSLELAKLGHFIGLNDISEAAIKKAHKLFKEHGVSNQIKWSHVGYIFDYKQEEVAWDSFISHRVLHTMPEEQRILSLNFMAKKLIKNGKALISAKSINCNRFEILKKDSTFLNIKKEEDKGTFVRQRPFKYIHYFDRNSLKNAILNSGLKILEEFEFEEETGNISRPEGTKVNKYWLFVCYKSLVSGTRKINPER